MGAVTGRAAEATPAGPPPAPANTTRTAGAETAAAARAAATAARLADTFAAGYRIGLADAAAHPLSEERRARLALLISPAVAGRVAS